MYNSVKKSYEVQIRSKENSRYFLEDTSTGVTDMDDDDG